MSSSVSVTVRCTDCSRVLATYYGVPRGPEPRSRLVAASRDLLEWHRILTPTCKARAGAFSDRAEPR